LKFAHTDGCAGLVGVDVVTETSHGLKAYRNRKSLDRRAETGNPWIDGL
jgi:hypothetical protein